MRELEAKFDATEDFEMPALNGVSILDVSSVRLTATYWDTPDRALLRWGHTMRHRHASDGSENGWTLKLGSLSPSDPVALDRQEVDVPGSPQHPPSDLRDLVTGLVRGEPVMAVATVETDRHRMVIADQRSDEHVAVEVSDDRVSSTVGGRLGATFRQIEVEALTSGSGALMRAVAEHLVDAGATATTTSKLAKVLGERPDPEISVPRVGRNTTIGTVVRAAIGSGVRELIGNDPGIRLGADPEAVHKGRVATRRLRSNLKSLEPLLVASRVAWLRSELSWAGTLLGAVRDLDVLISRVEEAGGQLPEVDRVAVDAIIDGLREDRRLRHLELADALGSARYLHLVDRLIEAAASPPFTASSDPKAPARPPLRRLVRKAWRRTVRAVERLGDKPSDVELHEIRKRAKRARYASELASGVFGKEAARFARGLEALQDVLGEVQDTVVAEQRLREGSIRLAGSSAFSAGTLACIERRERRRARKRWPEVWKTARSKRRRRWLR